MSCRGDGVKVGGGGAGGELGSGDDGAMGGGASGG